LTPTLTWSNGTFVFSKNPRAEACHVLEINHCALAATRGVYNAQRRQYWDMVIERFTLKEPFRSEMPARMIAIYEDKLIK